MGRVLEQRLGFPRLGHLLTSRLFYGFSRVLEQLLFLDRPLVIFDTETTGINARADRIIEIACVKIHPHGARETWVKRVNPGLPIPPSSTAIHGIRDSEVASLPRFGDIALELARFLEGCDLAGYNITGFDLPILRTEFLRAGIVFEISDRRLLDAQRIFFTREPRHLAAAARLYCDAEHNGAHGALADAEMTLRVLAGQLERYGDLPRRIGELHELFCAGLDQDMDPEGRFRMVQGQPTVNFGKNRGRKLRDMSREEPGFLRWILKGDFSSPVKEIARQFLPPEDETHSESLSLPLPPSPGQAERGGEGNGGTE
jgi:DNA polymerase III subunit epsilon